MSLAQNCPCGSLKSVDQCCNLYITSDLSPPSPEALMRSRFTAYCQHNYDYIYKTYTKQKREQLTVREITEAAKDTTWLRLTVLSSFEIGSEGEVEFYAHYKIKSDFYIMHEHSFFIVEDDSWRYLKGDMMQKTGKLKVSRNQSCVCGSGLKLKRCCLSS